MSLREKQSRFAMSAAKLILKAYELGYEVTFGDAYRDPRLHGEVGVKLGYGHRKSAHKMRLAIDLNLYKDGRYLTRTEDHRELGEWWKTQGEGHAWGGDFDDGNHYSIMHDGIR